MFNVPVIGSNHNLPLCYHLDMRKPNQRQEFGATVPKHYVGEPSKEAGRDAREEAAKEVMAAAMEPPAEPSPVFEETVSAQPVADEPIVEDSVPYRL
jgi:hypothetical protein